MDTDEFLFKRAGAGARARLPGPTREGECLFPGTVQTSRRSKNDSRFETFQM